MPARSIAGANDSTHGPRFGRRAGAIAPARAVYPPNSSSRVSRSMAPADNAPVTSGFLRGCHPRAHSGGDTVSYCTATPSRCAVNAVAATARPSASPASVSKR